MSHRVQHPCFCLRLWLNGRMPSPSQDACHSKIILAPQQHVSTGLRKQAPAVPQHQNVENTAPEASRFHISVCFGGSGIFSCAFWFLEIEFGGHLCGDLERVRRSLLTAQTT
eukprot:3941538-Rhodomonas_salina.14